MAIGSGLGFPDGGAPLSEECFRSVSAATGVGFAEWWSFLATETGACGFLPDARPTVRPSGFAAYCLTRGPTPGE
jgi:hypothetical protein